MAFQLTDIVPWGRSLDEYVAMFALSEQDLGGPILGCGDGPASFNCELTARGGSVVSVDPLYDFPAGRIRERIAETFEEIMAQVRRNMEAFVWKDIASIEELGRIRMAAMRRFLSDYDQGRSAGRYLPESLPLLSFSDNTFNLALCSHFLFLYSDKLDLQFHIESIREMCRVAAEARIFPLLRLDARPCPFVPVIVSHFKQAGYHADVMHVPYEFQRGGNEMLRIRRAGPL